MIKSMKRACERLIIVILVAVLVLSLFGISPRIWRWFYPLHFADLLEAAGRREGIDPNLIAAVINVESKWQPKAVSPKGATGLMQLMPDTAQWAADKVGLQSFSQTDLLEPETNIRLGSWYLADLLRQFDQNLTVALAAYNGGRGNVRKWLEQGVWSGTFDDVESIPFGETKRYVLKVLYQYETYTRLYRWD
jgi:soluble lytic murein transglycosylase